VNVVGCPEGKGSALVGFDLKQDLERGTVAGVEEGVPVLLSRIDGVPGVVGCDCVVGT
jgi:hypothetical protein